MDSIARPPVTVVFSRSQLLPWPANPSSKLMLAFALPEERAALMRGMTPVRYTKKTIATFPALRKALEQIRRDGYAIGDEERDEGVRGVAAPVLSGGFARYGVAVTAPSYRLTGARLQEVTEAVRAAAAKITEALRPTEF